MTASDLQVRRRCTLGLFYLEKVELNRSRPAKDSNHDLERISIGVHFVHHAVEARKRAVDDLDGLAFLKRQFRFRLIRCSRNPINDLLNLLITEGSRILS